MPLTWALSECHACNCVLMTATVAVDDAQIRSQGEPVDETDTSRWTEAIGLRLRQARGAMSKREAARRAGFSEGTWRALELGVRRPARGIVVPMNPTVENLVAAAGAVGVDAAELLGLIGLDYQPAEDGTQDGDEVGRRLTALEARAEVTDLKLDRILRKLGAEP